MLIILCSSWLIKDVPVKTRQNIHNCIDIEVPHLGYLHCLYKLTVEVISWKLEYQDVFFNITGIVWMQWYFYKGGNGDKHDSVTECAVDISADGSKTILTYNSRTLLFFPWISLCLSLETSIIATLSSSLLMHFQPDSSQRTAHLPGCLWSVRVAETEQTPLRRVQPPSLLVCLC